LIKHEVLVPKRALPRGGIAATFGGMKTKVQILAITSLLFSLAASAECWVRDTNAVQQLPEAWQKEFIEESKLPQMVCFEPTKVLLNAPKLGENQIVLRANAKVAADQFTFFTEVNTNRALFISHTSFEYEKITGLSLKRTKISISMRVDPKTGEILDQPKLSAVVGVPI